MATVVTFQEEALRDVLPDLQDHWVAHHAETQGDQDRLPLDVDLALYTFLEGMGRLSLVTLRVDGIVQGYLVSIVYHHPQSQQVLSATSDNYYVAPAYRRGWLPYRLIEHAELFLRARGVQKVFAFVRQAHDVGLLFRRHGWRATDTVYSKWIGD